MYNKWALRCDKSPETKQAALYRKSFFRFQTFTTDKSPDKIFKPLPFLRLLMIIRMRNLFALARRNINLRPDCPNHEQGSDSFELIRLLSSDGLVGEFPVEKKPISDYWCFCHKTTTKTNKQTKSNCNNDKTQAEVLQNNQVHSAFVLQFSYTFYVFQSESTFGEANKMQLKKISSHRLKSK